MDLAKLIKLTPVEFIEQHVVINSGTIPFILKPKQKEVAQALSKGIGHLLIKTRRAGISKIAIGLALRELIIFSRTSYAFISINEGSSNSLQEEFFSMINRIDPSLVAKHSQHSIELKNLSIIRFISAQSAFSHLCGVSLDGLVFDEAAYIPNLEELILSNRHRLSTSRRPKLYIISTQNTPSTHFNKLCYDTFCGKTEYKLHRIHWSAVHDLGWYERMRPMFTNEHWHIEMEAPIL